MVVTHPTTGEQLSIGMDVVAVPRLRAALEEAELSGCDFVMAPLFHPRYVRVFDEQPAALPKTTRTSFRSKTDHSAVPLPPLIERTEPLTRADTELSYGEWMSGVIGKISPWIRLESTNDTLRIASEKAFRQEISFASHLSLRATIVNAPTSGIAANFGRSVNSALQSMSHIQLWVRIPVVFPAVNGKPDTRDPWELWNTIRNMCDTNPNLGIVLVLGADLPPRNELDRWLAEPVKVLVVSTTSFVLNKVGYPVLSKRHQDFIKVLFKYKTFCALSGRGGSSAKVKGGDGYKPFVQYLAHLFGKQPPSTEAEAFEMPYHDYLQAPLQPLADNLESQTYETFERDPIKYQRYQEAIRDFLLDRMAGEPTSENDGGTITNPPEGPIVIMVLGAGRGPLVKAALNAAQDAGNVPIRVFAVEKNPNAVVTLDNMKLELGWNNVTVICADMRTWDAPTGADAVVSELLGSFGDNELSPECLDGATRFLKPDGISIPSSYTSWLAPLASSKLHNEVRAYGDTVQNFETPYVVSIHRGKVMAPAQPCFRFDHPNRVDVPDNTRFKTFEFKIAEANMLHGLAGYFETVLYKDVKLSINPATFSVGMFSWFPLYIPIRNPMYLMKESTCQVQLWRKSVPGRVWYEWAITRPNTTPVHNPNGRSYWIVSLIIAVPLIDEQSDLTVRQLSAI